MSKRKESLNLVLILVVLVILFMGAKTKRDRESKPVDPSALELPYATHGSYLVGMRILETNHESPLLITVWYPALNRNNEEKISYRYEIKLGDPLGTVSIAADDGKAFQNAEYDFSGGAYPLIILSPGFAFGSSTYAWLAEHLASYGFVVIALEHQEHLDPTNELWRSAIKRPQDVSHVLNYIDEQIAEDGVFHGLINLEHVAVIGHSYGGYTSLAAAGARINTSEFMSHCEEASTSDHPAAWLCDELLPHLNDMADLAGLESTPDDLWPAWTDPRIAAIVPMAGDAFFFGHEGLAEINVPVMAIGGTKDNDAPYEWGTYPSYQYISSQRKVLISLTDAEHMIFTNLCEKTPFYLKPISGEFCFDADWDRNYAHKLISHFVTAFLLTEFKQDVNASTMLNPSNVEFPNMDYEARGY